VRKHSWIIFGHQGWTVPLEMCFELMLLYNHIFIQFQLYVSMNSEISDGIPVSEPASASGILYKV
jgi:hypothetical protein